MLLAAHGATTRGRRPTNEDAWLADLPLGLFVVADGMGGHNAGEVASELAIVTVRDAMGAAGESIDDRLGAAIRRANDHIFQAAHRRSDYAGMGTTVSAACVAGDRVVYANVGDSRIYLHHAGALTQLTRDDSWISRALDTGMPLTPGDIEGHPMRHVLTEVVGVRAEIAPPVQECEIVPGDMLLLCTDGLHGSVPADLLAAALGAAGAVDAIAEALVEQAIARGATDNVTALVVRCG
jgi:protein phosphatase